MVVEWNDKKISINLQIKFTFNEIDGEKGFYKILNDLQNIGLNPIGNRRGKKENIFILWYHLRVRTLPYPNYKTYNDIKEKYSNFLKEFTIENESKLDIDWTKDEINELSRIHIDKLLKLLLKSIDSSSLEVLISHAILNSKEATLSEEEKIKFGLVDNLAIVGKVFEEKIRLKEKEIQKIFQLIDTNDFIILKQLFYLIVHKSDFTASKLFDIYHNTKGKHPYSEVLNEFVWNNELAHHLSKLEMFFKDYILLESFIDEVREKARYDHHDIKIQIPFDIKAYNIDTKYKKPVAEMIIFMFNEKRKLVLNIFKMVLSHELKRYDINFDGLLISYLYNDSKEGIEILRKEKFYFDDLKELADAKLEPFRTAKKNGKINEFIIFRCNYITNRHEINYDWSKIFKVRDKNHKRIECHITQNRTYFNNLKMEMEDELEIQANLKVKYTYKEMTGFKQITSQFLEIIDIKIIDNFKVITYHLGTRYHEEKYFENTREGLSKFTYSTKRSEKETLCQTKILANPLLLLNFYEGENDIFYEVRCNGEVVCKTKKDLFDYLDEKNLIVDQILVKSAVSQIIRESITEYNLKKKPMYNTIGLFLNKKEELELVYEDDENKRIIAENDVQLDLIDKIKEKELDKKGELTEHFFKIIHIPTVPINVRLSILGYSAIAPFFYALSKELDFYPYLFLIGKHGSGKTTLLELFMNILFGTVMKTVDDMKSEARLTKFLTECLFMLNIDDIDKMDEDLLGFLKSFATRKSQRNRMDNQKMRKEQMYENVCGSANSNTFLRNVDDEAFRIRCIIHYLKTNLKATRDKKDRSKFEKHKKIIKESGLIYGIYLLEKSLEFIENIESDQSTKYKKILAYKRKIDDKIEILLNKKQIEISDVRRITLYSLIYIGWNFWDYTFKSKGLNSDLLKDALNFEGDIFLNYINELEKAERDINQEMFESVLEFLKQKLSTYGSIRCRSKDSEKDGKIFITTKFIADYDLWSRVRGYKPLKTLTNLSDLQSRLLNKDIRPGIYTYYSENGKEKGYGILFHYEELIALREGNAIQKKIDVDLSINFEKIAGKIKEIFEEIGDKEVEMKSLQQILGIEGDSIEAIKKSIQKLIETGKLKQENDKLQYIF